LCAVDNRDAERLPIALGILTRSNGHDQPRAGAPEGNRDTRDNRLSPKLEPIQASVAQLRPQKVLARIR
jgi:hypothetical protein